MIIQDEIGGPLYNYVAKDVKTAEIALKWISNCPGAILYFPQLPITFIFDNEKVIKFIEELVSMSPAAREYLLKKVGEEGFWDEFSCEDGEELDDFLDEYCRGEDESDALDIGGKLWHKLLEEFVGGLHKFGEDSNTSEGN